MALPLTSADKIPTQAVSEVVEHTVAMLLASGKEQVQLEATFTHIT